MFEPSWTLQIGDKQHQGIGLLHKPLWPLADDFDLFSVRLNGTQLIVRPKEGKMLQNLRTLWEGGPGRLVWFRRMRMMFDGHAPEKQCKCYGLGLEVNGKRVGYRLFEDGLVANGLD